MVLGLFLVAWHCLCAPLVQGSDWLKKLAGFMSKTSTRQTEIIVKPTSQHGTTCWSYHVESLWEHNCGRWGFELGTEPFVNVSYMGIYHTQLSQEKQLEFAQNDCNTKCENVHILITIFTPMRLGKWSEIIKELSLSTGICPGFFFSPLLLHLLLQVRQ